VKYPVRPSHDDYFLDMLELVAGRSTCARRAVGAIIVDQQHRILATGYNGVPTHYPHCTETPCPGAEDPPGDTRRCYAVHAEANALLQCSRLDLAWKLYASCTPCFSCAKLIANTSIVKVVCHVSYNDLTGVELLRKQGIYVQYPGC
jgi:dCMP deaminase